jgi:hypothetical protein
MKRDRLAFRFLAATAISLAAHAVLFAGAWLDVPRAIPEPEPLEARIVSVPAPPPPPPKAQPEPRPAAKRPPSRRVAALPKTAPSSPLVLPAAPEEVFAEEAPVSPAPEAPVEREVVAMAAPPGPDTPAVRTLPRKGRIAYTLYYGEDRFSVGRTVQTWEIDDGEYKLASVSETTGVLELFGAQRLNYFSQGSVTRSGFKPEKFLMSRTRRGRTEEALARFDWDAGTIEFGKSRERRSTALPGNAQDLVSFAYQLALAPPAPGRLRLPITNGSKFETYDIDVAAEEDIATPLGTLRALPVRQVRRPDSESIDIWLATEYRYLPVRIRFYDREGRPAGEQLVNEIRLSDE